MPTARAAQIVGMVLLYPMVFLSGAAGFPRDMLPSAAQTLSKALPLTYVVNLLQGLWLGNSWGQHTADVLILAAVLVAGMLISIRLIRWE